MSPSPEAGGAPTPSPSITLHLLRTAGRKGGAKSAGDPYWVSRYLYRPVTIYFSWTLAKVGVSANGATLLSAIAIFAAAVCYGLPQPMAWLVGAILVQIYFILDHVDGELARFERSVLGRNAGMSGVFYDTVCHAGETAVYAAIALRLYADLGHPWWVMLTLIVALFPGGMDPWQRCCEAVVVHLNRTASGAVATIDKRFTGPSSFTAGARDGLPLWRRAMILGLQTFGFPGYFVTLLVCTVLDVIPEARIVVADQPVPWLLIWIVTRALHKAAAGLKSTFVYGRRLRDLT